MPRSYDADTITSYEVGLKTDVGRRLSLDLAAFHLNWKDIQLFTVIDNFGLNANGGKAVSNGIEGTLTPAAGAGPAPVPPTAPTSMLT